MHGSSLAASTVAGRQPRARRARVPGRRRRCCRRPEAAAVRCFAPGRALYPRLVLIDLSLPDCHGTTSSVRSAGRRATREMPVVALSASVMARQTREARPRRGVLGSSRSRDSRHDARGRAFALVGGGRICCNGPYVLEGDSSSVAGARRPAGEHRERALGIISIRRRPGAAGPTAPFHEAQAFGSVSPNSGPLRQWSWRPRR